MGDKTRIEWADHSWSPWRGCTKVSPGCANCYAEKLSRRNPAVLGEWGRGKPRVLAKNWDDPVRWNKRASVPVSVNWDCRDDCGEPAKAYGPRPRVFPSLCDWLDEEVPTKWRVQFLRLIFDTPHLDWLLLTKRPSEFHVLMARCLDAIGKSEGFPKEGTPSEFGNWAVNWLSGKTPPHNVWFGVSVESQMLADERIPVLLRIPARIRWLSLEPLLGPVDLTGFLWGKDPVCEHCSRDADCTHGMTTRKDNGQSSLDWFVIGGESGPGARPCLVEWIECLIKQGADAGVPVFTKQFGSSAYCIREPGRPERGVTRLSNLLKHPKGGDPAEWPEHLRVREYP